MNRRKYLQHKETARALVKVRLAYLNQFYNFKFNKVFIKNHKRRWGSCSSRKNLNFNYKIIFLSSALADYLIVHELCHLKEMNHSIKFWNLVAQTVKNHKQLDKILKKVTVL